MNKKLRFTLQVLVLSILLSFVISFYLMKSMQINSESNVSNNYLLSCNIPVREREFSVFRGGKVTDFVCYNSINFFRNDGFGLHEVQNNNGELGYWTHIEIGELVEPNSETFFCSNERGFEYAFISIELIPLAKKSGEKATIENSVHLSDQVYLQSWEIGGFAYSRYWRTGHPLNSSIRYIYDRSDYPTRKIIESNVAKLYRASMSMGTTGQRYKANLKCVQHPMDV